MSARLEWPAVAHVRRGRPSITCDRCAATHEAPFPCGVILARARFAEDGWRRQDHVVLCPNCAALAEKREETR